MGTFSPLLSGFPDRPLSGNTSFPAGHPEDRDAEKAATGDGTRATGWWPISLSACLRYFLASVRTRPAQPAFFWRAKVIYLGTTGFTRYALSMRAPCSPHITLL